VGNDPDAVAVGDFNGQLGIVTANAGYSYDGVPSLHSGEIKWKTGD
jgi:hypothetical protein